MTWTGATVSKLGVRATIVKWNQTSVGEQVQVQVAGEQSFAPQDRQYCDSILSKEHSCNDQIYHV